MERRGNPSSHGRLYNHLRRRQVCRGIRKEKSSNRIPVGCRETRKAVHISLSSPGMPAGREYNNLCTCGNGVEFTLCQRVKGTAKKWSVATVTFRQPRRRAVPDRRLGRSRASLAKGGPTRTRAQGRHPFDLKVNPSDGSK